MHGPTFIFWANLTPFSLQSHAHSATFDPSGRWLLVGEKGLDKVRGSVGICLACEIIY